MFVPDRLKTNAFRVLRLSADASLSEMHKAAGNMRRAVMLGVVNTTEADMPSLGGTSRTEPDIRAAVGRLENPTQRLCDRLFWFHLPPRSQEAKAPTRSGQPVGDHDEALRGLFAALEDGFDDAGVRLWIRALREWHQVVADDAYWTHTLELEQQGAFEPSALQSEVDALRDGAVNLAAEPLIVAGRDALAGEDTLTVRRILNSLEGLADTGPWVVNAQHDIASPAVERFRSLCRGVHEDYGTKVIREKDAAERNKSVCDAELNRFRAQIEPELNKIILLLAPGHQAVDESRETAALCLSRIASDYTWANDFITSEKLQGEALRLAHGTLGTITIEHSLEQIRAAARTQRVFGSPISSAPALFTLNGFGCTVYGSSDPDPETQSYVTTHYFVVFLVPIFPLGRYRVVSVGESGYSFLGKLPLRKADRWHLGIAVTAIVATMLTLVFAGVSSPRSERGSVPSASSRSISHQSGPREDYASSSPTSQLSALKFGIDSGRLQIAQLKLKLQPVLDEIHSLNAQMTILKTDLKLLARQQRAGIQIDVDDYNAKVKTHNLLLASQRSLVAANSIDLKAYDDLIDHDTVLVNKYNALLKAIQ